MRIRHRNGGQPGSARPFLVEDDDDVIVVEGPQQQQQQPPPQRQQQQPQQQQQQEQQPLFFDISKNIDKMQLVFAIRNVNGAMQNVCVICNLDHIVNSSPHVTLKANTFHAVKNKQGLNTNSINHFNQNHRTYFRTAAEFTAFTKSFQRIEINTRPVDVVLASNFFNGYLISNPKFKQCLGFAVLHQPFSHAENKTAQFSNSYPLRSAKAVRKVMGELCVDLRGQSPRSLQKP